MILLFIYGCWYRIHLINAWNMEHIWIRLSMLECPLFCNKFHPLYLWGPEKLDTLYVLRKKQCLQLLYEWKSKLKTSAFWNLRPCGLVITTETAIFWKPGALLSDYNASHPKKPPISGIDNYTNFEMELSFVFFILITSLHVSQKVNGHAQCTKKRMKG
jgi:hypothetical protein